MAADDAPTSSWSPLVDGNELNDGLYALVFDDTGRALYAAGRFTSAGGVSATYIARWDQATASWSALGSSMNDRVLALAWDSAGSALYAGGEFATDDGWSLMDPHLVIVAGGHTIWLPVVVKVADSGGSWY